MFLWYVFNVNDCLVAYLIPYTPRGAHRLILIKRYAHGMVSDHFSRAAHVFYARQRIGHTTVPAGKLEAK